MDKVMTEKSAIATFVKELGNSAFNQNYYSVDLPIDMFIVCALRYIDRKVSVELDNGEVSMREAVDVLLSTVPDYQRVNDKWTPVMQSQYVRNVLRGCRNSPLIFSHIKPLLKSDCRILDGLQRLTALSRFFVDDEMPIEDNQGRVFMSGDLRQSKVFSDYCNMLCVPLRIYQFNSELDEVNFYIEMNEGITHSADDIARAKAYRNVLLSRI